MISDTIAIALAAELGLGVGTDVFADTTSPKAASDTFLVVSLTTTIPGRCVQGETGVDRSTVQLRVHAKDLFEAGPVASSAISAISGMAGSNGIRRVFRQNGPNPLPVDIGAIITANFTVFHQ